MNLSGSWQCRLGEAPCPPLEGEIQEGDGSRTMIAAQERLLHSAAGKGEGDKSSSK